MLHPAPDRAEVQIAHVTFDGRHEWLTFRCTVKAVRGEVAVILRDSQYCCEEVAVERLAPRPAEAYWRLRGDGNNSYMLAQNPAQNGI